MPEQVNSSGHISLGKQYAGSAFDIIVHPDGRLELIPAGDGVPLPVAHAAVEAPDGWPPPGGYGTCTAWALENRAALENYAQENEAQETAAEQLQRYLTLSD